MPMTRAPEKPKITGSELPAKKLSPPVNENAERAPGQDRARQDWPLIFDTPEKQDLIRRRAMEMVDLIIEEHYNILVFLDRSARPIYWILREAWRARGVAAPFPETRFLNIGREKMKLTDGFDRPQGDEDEKEFWGKFNSTHYVKEMKKRVADQPSHRDWLGRQQQGKVLIVDDVSVSGMTLSLADNFLSYHLPGAEVIKSHFFHEEDEAIFHVAGRNGVNTPWNIDKSLTLMAADDPERVARVTAQTEKDKQKRSKGLALKQEIKSLFAKDIL